MTCVTEAGAHHRRRRLIGGIEHRHSLMLSGEVRSCSETNAVYDIAHMLTAYLAKLHYRNWP
jgi:hypothetical protein